MLRRVDDAPFRLVFRFGAPGAAIIQMATMSMAPVLGHVVIGDGGSVSDAANTSASSSRGDVPRPRAISGFPEGPASSTPARAPRHALPPLLPSPTPYPLFALTAARTEQLALPGEEITIDIRVSKPGGGNVFGSGMHDPASRVLAEGTAAQPPGATCRSPCTLGRGSERAVRDRR